MNCMRLKSKYTLIAFAMLLTAGYRVAKGKPHLEQITILKNYGAPVTCELQWRDRHGAHTKQLQDKQINSGQQTIKAPLLGYYLDRIVALSSNMAAAAVFSLGATLVEFQGSIHADKNRYFVVSAGSIPKKAVKGKTDHKVDIAGYANEQAYKDSLVAKPGTQAMAVPVKTGAPATPAPVVVATSPVPTPPATSAPAK